MNPPSPGLPPPRVAPNARHAFGGIWRLTVRPFLTPGHGLVLAGTLSLFALVSVSSVHDGRADQYFQDSNGNGLLGIYLKLLVPIVAFVFGAGAIRDDLKPGSVDYVFTRPVRRPVFIVFRYLAHMACTQADFVLALGVLIGAGRFRHIPDLLSAVPMLFLAQALLIAAFSAFGMLCGILTSRYMILGFLYAGAVEVGIGHIPTQLSRLSMTRQVWRMLQPLMAERVPVAPLAGQNPGVLMTVGLLLAFSAVMLAATVATFALRELAGAPGREA